MITEDQLEQLAISWFQDTGWGYAQGPIKDVVLRSSRHERRRQQVTHFHAKCQLVMTLEELPAENGQNANPRSAH
jgi:hypothetical protein